MGLLNLGSVAATTLDLLEDVPENISGTRLLEISDRQRNKVEEYTGRTIGSNSIEITYQEAILQLTISKTAKDMMSLGADASNIKLGEFSVSKGSTSNLDVISKNSYQSAMDELKCIGKKSLLLVRRGIIDY